MHYSDNYTLTQKEIDFIQSLDLSAYEEFHLPPDQLCYQHIAPAFEKANPRQRGYIHGLSKKLDIDEYTNLPYYVRDIRYLTSAQAAEVIDILLNMQSKTDSIF